MSKKLTLEKGPGKLLRKLVLEKVPGKLRLDVYWQNDAIYALCQPQNFGSQTLSTILHPWLW